MAIDLNAIRNRLDSLQTKTTKTDNLWKPKPGKQQVRIVPYVHNPSNPFIELFFHYNFGGKNILSPQTHGEADPLVEFADQLKSTGDRNDWNLSKQLTPKMRTYVPVIVRGKESEGVKFWGFGKTIYSELLSIIADPDYGDITDLMNGRDIDVEFTPSEGPGQYPKTAIRVKPNTSAATEDKAIAKSIMDQPKITDLFPEPTYEELQTALNDWMNPESADSDTSTPKAAATPATETKSNDTVTKKTDVAEAFDDLFNN